MTDDNTISNTMLLVHKFRVNGLTVRVMMDTQSELESANEEADTDLMRYRVDILRGDTRLFECTGEEVYSLYTLIDACQNLILNYLNNGPGYLAFRKDYKL